MKLALGLAALGRPAYINVGHAEALPDAYAPGALERRCHAVLDAAWAAGLTWFDAARSYGRSEEFLAKWLQQRGITRSHVTVSSKWGYRYVANWQPGAEKHEVKEHTLEALERQLAESRAMLGPWLSLYQVHSATLDSGVLQSRAVLERLGGLRDEGLPIGLSLSGPKQREALELGLSVQHRGAPLFSSVQATWNLLERSVEPALRRAKGEGLTVIIKEALANGRLAGPGAPRALHALGSATPDAVALAAALAQPFADVVLSGASTPEQLRSNVAALWLDGAALADALETLKEPPEQYWQTRSKLPWN
ncbi:MAG: aldo/keto reductase [Myxococcaceae bacterium]|nr:aldo/keto reductase [Myxococcaceae bacterium]